MVIGIIGAMDEEIRLFKESIEFKEEVVKATITFYVGIFKGKDVVICKSGVGKVNAAITTQLLIDHFSVSKIIFTGVAGAVDHDLNIGDIVISTSAVQHDLDASALGFKKGEVPMFDFSSDFPADSELIELAQQASSCLEGVNVVTGRVLSGDQFIADHKKVEELDKVFSGKCVEMEGASVAHVAMLNSIPFVVIRSMSDKANGEANVNFTEFTKLASERSYTIVQNMLEKIL
ncbi:5'-methylthioadenosine/S-adenosylhomocysteine nucleosidase [Anaerobacillus alkalidiazotrophicus]|uniref:adenosylhomocysteine nucleosidase n=1 Tax=Anaerobacillus alkalidiazotrophicus TaxID=472963 RepID=A0A1S2M4P8_9BACI|nr:5'-methylthioadenosine/adenosylhomocysteine nucleosidase [Anaerobacillus alkalidiazotrophicus]OIJ18230.1 5'-methylthioadenosine/S-adenosylhomocysteine nucleosidase [Anaerobacillus alkalidiazotrophicus]OIJ19709.1 5'-methylthioadenosine/S-adenosylhomocysteine nucleosidase [Anaerobacillus alkalidiazotrophicus]